LAIVADFIVYGTASLVAHPILKGLFHHLPFKIQETLPINAHSAKEWLTSSN